MGLDFFIFSFGSVGRDLTEKDAFFFFFFHAIVSNISVYLCVISPIYELFLLILLLSLVGDFLQPVI